MSKKDAALVPPETFMPNIDVFEKDNRLVTKMDLSGWKKDDLTVEVVDGYLMITGKRTRGAEERKQDLCRWERQYFYRAVPLPLGVKLEDVKATFAEGMLEATVPIPPKPKTKARRVEIQEPAKPRKAAA